MDETQVMPELEDAFLGGLQESEPAAPEEAPAEEQAAFFTEDEPSDTRDGAVQATEEAPDTQDADAPGDGDTPQSPARIPVVLGGGQAAQLDAAAVQSLAQSLGMPVQDVLQTVQKGMAYERKNERELNLLSEYAAANDMTLAQYVEYLERQKDELQLETEVRRVAGELPEGTPDEAIRRIAQGNLERQRAEQSGQAARQHRQAYEQNVNGWMALFTEQPELRQNAPGELFQILTRHNCSPAEAYYRMQAQRQDAQLTALREELTQAKQMLAAAQKNARNARTAVGSMSTAGEAAGDPFLAGLVSDGF